MRLPANHFEARQEGKSAAQVATKVATKKTGVTARNRNPLIFMVGGAGIEPATSTV
jgi:hypothetical protein